MKDFNNTMVFIPGGSSGIGLSAARILGAEGANVVIFARKRKRLEEAAAKVMSADEVAKDLIRHIRKGTFMIIPGLDGKIAFIAKRLFPRLVENMMDHNIRKVRGKAK